MFRKITYGLGILFLSLSCSLSDNQVIASYSMGGKRYEIKLGDVKKGMLDYAMYDNSLPSRGIEWHKDYITKNYLKPRLITIEQIQSGITNSPDFQENFARVNFRAKEFALLKNGKEIVNKKVNQTTTEIARASHILIYVSKYKTVSNKIEELSEEEYQSKLKEAEMLAKNIIESILASKDPLKEFIKIAKEKSGDPTSATNGGDIGYFTRSQVVKEFGDAVFNSKNRGLIKTPVKTQFGLHIIYITEPPRKVKISQLKSKLKNNYSTFIEENISSTFMRKDISNVIKENYSLDEANKKIVIDNIQYEVTNIPDDKNLLIVYGKPYSWKELKELITFYVPWFSNNANYDNFKIQMGQAKNYLYLRDLSKNRGYEKTDSFRKDYNKMLEDYQSRFIYDSFRNDLFEKVKSLITETDLKEFYKTNQQLFIREENGKKRVLPYKNVAEEIRRGLVATKMQELENEWLNSAIKKYNVSFNENIIKKLISMEEASIAKIKKGKLDKK